MSGTLWLWLAGTALVCVSLQVSALPYSDTRAIQDNSLLSLKRTKPSLSIVNPLDVLRQRIILEMARRQMRENTRQVELNKALLREIGKRSSNYYQAPEEPLDYAYYDRKQYNQRMAADSERNAAAEDELEAMVESLLRGSHLTLRDGAHQRVRSINARPVVAPSVSQQNTDQPLSAQSPAQLQPQPLGSLFNNEQEPGQQKNEAYPEQASPADDEDGDEPMGTGTGTLKGLTAERDNFLDASQAGPTKIDSRQPTGNDRNVESDFRPRYVYGMYKNRYAN